MVLVKIIDKIKKTISQPDKKKWLDKLVTELEEQRFNFESLPFKIIEFKKSGFLVKVNGLFGFISIYHMPWKYNDKELWATVAPYLIDKVFFCKVHKIDKDPIAIIVNGEIPQFKKLELVIGDEYTGVILKNTDYGIFVDIGKHFDWRCGSIVGLMHKTQILINTDLKDYATGQEITAIYLGLNDKNQYLFSNDRDKADWYMGIPQGLVGDVTWAKVIRDASIFAFLILGKYKAKLTIDKNHSAKYKRRLKQEKKELRNGQIINCEILGANESHRILTFKWLGELDTKVQLDNSLVNNLDKNTITNLIKIKNGLNY